MYALVLVSLLLAFSDAMAPAAEPKRVLVIHSFGSVSPPFTTESTAFVTELTERQGEAVDLDEVFLEHARYGEAEMQELLVDYLQKRGASWRPDLVVPIGSPASRFVAQYRDRLFPETPILHTGSDRRRVPPEALDRNAAYIGCIYDGPGFVEDILQIAPDTTNIVMVIGASALEQYWKGAYEREFDQFTNRVGFTWLNGLPFEQILGRLATLPPHSFIFLYLFLRDAAGVSHNADDALKRIHAVANAPVNGLFDYQLGLGIVGGRLYPDELLGAEAAHIAIRILHGEPVSSFSPQVSKPLGPQYDWRELRRWKIGEDNLPRGSQVKFRQPTLWGRYRGLIVAGTVVCAVQAVLIFVLLLNLRKRRAAEHSLRESEERMKLAANAAELNFWEWDLQSNRIWIVGPATARISTANDGMVDYDHYMKMVHPDDRDAVAQAAAKSIAGNGEYHNLHRAMRADGQIRWVAVSGRVEFDRVRRPLRMRGVSIDATARKEAEDRARESERAFVLMANAAPVLIWTSDPDKLCTFFNEPWLKFTGRTMEQELGNGWTDGVHPHDLPQCMKTYEEAFEARHPFSMEYRLRHHDGEYRWVLDHGVARYDTNQKFLGYVGSCVDVTERKRAETEAQRWQRELAHVTRVSTLGELAGSLAHELNQPLTAILSNAQAAQRMLNSTAKYPQELREALADIVEEDRRAGEVILRMRAMLKKGETKMAPLDLNQIIGEVLRLLHSELLIRAVATVTHLTPRLPLVRSDRVELQQVLINLIINACDAMSANPPGERKVTIETQLLDPGEAQVAVSDLGPGFSPEFLERGFEPFQTSKSHGLGLGLPICRSIISAHGGRLWLANTGKGGAVVYVALAVDRKEMV
jgi:PAS domain S-box-containing protein